MSDELIEATPGSCQGTYDATDDLCGICAIRGQCEKMTRELNKPKRPEPKSSVPDEPDMEPLEFILQLMNGRYAVQEVNKGKAMVYYFRKDGKPMGFFQVLQSGKMRVCFRSERVSVDLILASGLSSTREASDLFKALLV